MDTKNLPAMRPMEYRKHIAASFERLITLINKPDHGVNPRTIQESLHTYLELAESCVNYMISRNHTKAMQAFIRNLSSIAGNDDGSARLKTAVQKFFGELENLDPFWLYKRQGDNWLVFRIAEGQYDETMAIVETEGLALKVLDLCGVNDNPRAISVKFDSLPDGFRIEEGSDDDWDLYRTPEAIDDEDEPEEEWFATVNTEHMAQILCERMIGYHV